jgi:hypothetical protein
MTKQELIEWALRHGYTKDKYGHLQKTRDNVTHRLKLQATSARIERQLVFEHNMFRDRRTEWYRIRSGYYKNLSINPENDKLVGMR